MGTSVRRDIPGVLFIVVIAIVYLFPSVFSNAINQRKFDINREIPVRKFQILKRPIVIGNERFK